MSEHQSSSAPEASVYDIRTLLDSPAQTPRPVLRPLVPGGGAVGSVGNPSQRVGADARSPPPVSTELDVVVPEVLPAVVRKPRPRRQRLTPAALNRLKTSVPAETLRAYEREWGKFVAWCALQGDVPLPCDADTLTNWVAARCDSGDGLSAIRQGVSAVVFNHEGQSDLTKEEMPSTKDAWKIIVAYQRELADAGVRENKAAAFTAEQFRLMQATLPEGKLATVRDRAMAATAVGGHYRRSNVARLDIKDVTKPDRKSYKGPPRLRVRLTRSKTDQRARGRTTVLTSGKHALSDPVGLLQAWLTALAEQGITSGPLWRPISRSGRILDRRLHDDHLRTLIRDMARKAGVTNEAGLRYSAHSTRSTGVTLARVAGASWDTIREHGGWSPKSSVVFGYDRSNDGQGAMEGSGL